MKRIQHIFLFTLFVSTILPWALAFEENEVIDISRYSLEELKKINLRGKTIVDKGKKTFSYRFSIRARY